MLHTQVSKVMQVKKQKQNKKKNLLFPCVCPRTSAIHQHNSGKKNDNKKTSQNPQISISFVKSLYEQACLISLK